MRKLLFYILINVLILGWLPHLVNQSVFAGGSLYLSPGATSVAGGSSFSLSVRVNATSAVDAVQANLSYPADKLTFLGTSYSGTGFEIQAENSGGGGSIRMGRGSLSAKSGDNLIATISFQAIPSSGSATVSFTSGSEAVKGGSIVASATSGATITFTKATTPEPKPKDKKAPKISDLKVINIGLKKATVTWKTNEKATTVVEYGPTKKLGITSSSNKLVKNHKIALSEKLLLPGSKYYYKVKSQDKAGNVGTSKITSFDTKGYSIKLKIVDSKGNLLSNVNVKLIPGSEETTTNESGVAYFTDVAPGDHSVNVTVGDQVLAAQIEVEESGDSEQIQEIEVKIAAAAKTQTLEQSSQAVLVVVALIVIFVGGYFLWGRKRLKVDKK
jgi:hypothetical protein